MKCSFMECATHVRRRLQKFNSTIISYMENSKEWYVSFSLTFLYF